MYSNRISHESSVMMNELHSMNSFTETAENFKPMEKHFGRMNMKSSTNLNSLTCLEPSMSKHTYYDEHVTTLLQQSLNIKRVLSLIMLSEHSKLFQKTAGKYQELMNNEADAM